MGENGQFINFGCSAMLNPAVIFWVATALVVYTFLAYPLLIALVAKFKRQSIVSPVPFPSSFSLVLSVRNEQAHIKRRLEELDIILKNSPLPAELIVICDGSTDDTPSIARTFSRPTVQVVELQTNQGKAVALNHAAALAKNEILIFADARQTWQLDAAHQLLSCFQDERVGAVSGQLVLKTADGNLAGVGMYWKFEKWLRGQEAHVHSQIGVTGAICAVRRELFPLLPPGILLDDVYWPMQVVMRGRRVVYQPQAVAYDQLPDRSSDEMRRKIRTLVGNFQLLTISPALLSPWKNSVWWQFVSHKVMRLVAPWALLVMLVSSAVMETGYYRTIFAFLAGGMLMGILGMLTPLGRKNRLFSTAGSFLLLQFAAWLAFWYWIFGRSEGIWTSLPSPAATTDQV